MATELDHIALANKNHEVLFHLNEYPDRFPEWITTVAFYKAVQLIEALVVRQRGGSCNGHDRRMEALKSLGERDLYRHYRALWGASCVARYLYDTAGAASYSTFSDYCEAGRVYDRFVKKRLRPIEQLVIGRLSNEGKKCLQRVPS